MMRFSFSSFKASRSEVLEALKTCYSKNVDRADDFPPENAPILRRGGSLAPVFEPSKASGSKELEQARREADEDSKLAEQIRRLNLAPSTQRAYASAIRQWNAYATKLGRDPFPVDLGLFQGWLVRGAREGNAYSTVIKKMAAVHKFAALMGQPGIWQNRELIFLRSGLARELGVAPKRQSAALPLSELIAMVQAIEDPSLRLDDPPDGKGKGAAVVPTGDRLIDYRDRAMLLFAYQGFFRPSEVSNFRVEDLTKEDKGFLARVRSSKSDQIQEGEIVGILRGRDVDLCPVIALELWIALSGITRGPLFRYVSRHGHVGPKRLSPWGVRQVVKRRGAAIGLEPSALGGHSLRRGPATEAARQGIDGVAIQRRGRWKSAASVKPYIDEGFAFEYAEQVRML